MIDATCGRVNKVGNNLAKARDVSGMSILYWMILCQNDHILM